MKDYINTRDLAIWITLIAGQGILCVCILKKHLFSRLLWFSIYIFSSTIQSIVLLGAAFLAPYSTYYHTFYQTGHAISALAFLTLVELARQVLPGLNLPRKEKAFGGLLLVWAGVITFAWFWPMHSLGNEKRIEVAGCLAIATAFIFVAAYSRYLGLYWSRLVGGTAFTLGVMYLIDGITKAMIAHYAYPVAVAIRQIREVAHIVAVVAWIAVILLPWGEYELTEEELRKAERIVLGTESNLRDFVLGGARKV